MTGHEPSRQRGRLAATAHRADVLFAELRRLECADLVELHGVCAAAGVRDPRDVVATPSVVFEVRDALDAALAGVS